MHPTFAVSLDHSTRLAARLADPSPSPEDLLAEAEVLPLTHPDRVAVDLDPAA